MYNCIWYPCLPPTTRTHTHMHTHISTLFLPTESTSLGGAEPRDFWPLPPASPTVLLTECPQEGPLAGLAAAVRIKSTRSREAEMPHMTLRMEWQGRNVGGGLSRADKA